MKKKPLLISFLIIAILWASFLLPWTRPLWDFLDTAIFNLLNALLKAGRPMQYFWALINHKRMDLIEDAIFLSFFIWGIWAAPKARRWKTAAHFVCTIALTACVISFINRGLFSDPLSLPRKSPSLIITSCVRITQEISWKGIKDETIASFPGDHATTLLLFGFLFGAVVPKRIRWTAWGYIFLRILPRLVVGAHWFSDIAIGSLSIALFFAALYLYTPIGRWAVSAIETQRKSIAKLTA